MPRTPFDEETDASPRARRSDSKRNRDAVVDALLALYTEGNLSPSSADIADRAGLSARSLFRYFDDVDDLCRAAITRQQARARPFLRLAVGPGATVAERAAALAGQRDALFDAISAVGAVSRLRAPFQPVIATELANARSYLRHQVEKLFAPELSAMGRAGRERVLPAADVLCSFEAYQLLRHDQGLSRSRTIAVLTSALRALFSPEHP